MLLDFSVENFRSIKERVNISFEAGNIQGLNDNFVKVEAAKSKEFKVLKTLSIFGPNASGKSNLIKALAFMRYYVIDSGNRNKGDSIPYEPFRLDRRWVGKPSSFDLRLVLNNVVYEYGFKINEREVVKEYLYHYPNGRVAVIFERERTQGEDSFRFTVNKKHQEFMASMTSANKLYLSVATNLENKLTEELYRWFKEKLVVHTANNFSGWSHYTTKLVHNNERREQILGFLKGADFDINEIKTSKSSIPDKKEMLEKMKVILSEDAINKLLKRDEIIEVKTTKIGKDDKGGAVSVEFDLEEESDGTNKFFELAGPIIDIITEGKCLVYDELDTKLHPNLLIFLVKVFNRNHNQAQVLFTAHNIAVLEQKYLRRDQIYFTDRKNDHSTELFSVYDFPTEKITSNLLRRYLSGRYGATPFIDEDRILKALLEGHKDEKTV